MTQFFVSIVLGSLLWACALRGAVIQAAAIRRNRRHG